MDLLINFVLAVYYYSPHMVDIVVLAYVAFFFSDLLAAVSFLDY